MAGTHHLVCASNAYRFLPIPPTRQARTRLTNCSSYIICILAATTLYFILRSENRKRESVPDDEAERAKLAFMDLTDKENPYFRYVL